MTISVNSYTITYSLRQCDLVQLHGFLCFGSSTGASFFIATVSGGGTLVRASAKPFNVDACSGAERATTFAAIGWKKTEVETTNVNECGVGWGIELVKQSEVMVG